jgi:hypothetical protein
MLFIAVCIHREGRAERHIQLDINYGAEADELYDFIDKLAYRSQRLFFLLIAQVGWFGVALSFGD